MLFLALALALVYANRTLLVDTRSTRYQVQASQAFEAAEAGIEWTTAMLNDPHPLDDTCQPTSAATAANLRRRLLDFDASTGLFVPRTWLDGSVAQPLQAACVRSIDGWQCSCPSTGLTHPPLVSNSIPQPSFLVSLQAASRPGTVQVTSTGCNNRGTACVSSSDEAVEGKAQVQTLLALLPALFTPPVAPLTARADVAAGGASIGLVNTDVTSGGVTVDAGGFVVAPSSRLTSAAGAATSLSVVEGDSALRALTTNALFARHFGMDKPTWRQRPGVVRITCAASCDDAMTSALATGATLIWVDGDLGVAASAVWGSSDQPVIVVATGNIKIDGALTMAGVLYGNGVVWNDTSPGSGSLHGALVSEAGYGGNGSPDLIYDPGILRALNVSTGTFVRVPGSWKDF